MQRLLPIALGAILVLAGCMAPLQSDDPSGAAAATAGQAATDGGVDGPTVSVTGTGEVETEADLAIVLLSVTATADTADEARSQVAGDVERMRAALREAGVADDAVTTSGFRIYPQYDHSERERELIGYQAAHSFRVEVAPDAAGTVVDAAVGNGASTVESVQFTLTDETRAELREQALGDAVSAARADADALAAATGLSISGVHSASTSGGFTPVYEERAESADGAAGGSTSFTPGPVTVSATVQLTYLAE